MIGGSVARRYAKALAMVAGEKGLWDELMEDLKALLPFWNTKDIMNFIHEPSLSRRERAKVVVNIAKEMGLNEMIKNFLELLALKGRLEFFPDIVREFEKVWEEERKRVRVVVRTPQKLSDRLRSRLATAVKNRTGREPIIMEVIDEELLGGITVEIEGCVYDGSAASMIKKFVESQDTNI